MHGFASFSNLTDLSAGGLRSSATVNAAQRQKAARARRVGTDPPNGLATAEWHPPLLWQGSSLGRGTGLVESVRNLMPRGGLMELSS